VAGFAPLVAGGLRARRLATVLETLRSRSFLDYPGLRWSLPPSTSPEDTGFNSRSYWRGPVWPVIDWLLWWAFMRAGEHQLAEDVRESSLEQIAEGGFAEYFEPFTGEPLGSREQSWTAAVALDWLAHGSRREMRAA
jgi:glucosylglycerate hydrolase